MRVEKLRLTDYRNYEQLEVSFEKGLNALIGENGSGKTNVVEAIAYLSLMKSFKGALNEDLIRNDKEFAVIEAKVIAKNCEKEIRFVLTPETRSITLDQNLIKKMSDFSGEVKVVSFIPEDVSLFRDLPKKRRQLMDHVLASLDRKYLNALTTYKNLLKTRNALLKENDIDEMELDVVTGQILEPQFEIEKRRILFIKEINDYLRQTFAKLDSDGHVVELVFEGLKIDHSSKEKFFETLKKRYEREKEPDSNRKATLTGIHKDDYLMLLNGRRIDSYGSQGQNRLAVLALKLSIAKFIEDKSGEAPILIFDDVMSELDKNHRDKLNELLLNVEQVFVTSVKKETSGAIYEIAHSQIMRRN